MLLAQKASNLMATSIVVPDTNRRDVSAPILPERFSSVSEPSPTSIVSPELNSVSEPKPSGEETMQVWGWSQ